MRSSRQRSSLTFHRFAACLVKVVRCTHLRFGAAIHREPKKTSRTLELGFLGCNPDCSSLCAAQPCRITLTLRRSKERVVVVQPDGGGGSRAYRPVGTGARR